MSDPGFCFACDRQVMILRQVPRTVTSISCSLCGGDFIERFELQPEEASTFVAATLSHRPIQQPSRITQSTTNIQASTSSAGSTSTPSISQSTINLLGDINNNLSQNKNKANGATKTEPKSKIPRMDRENTPPVDIDDTCSICLDEWTNSGAHRLVSLKCGHLFGESCIRRWLQTSQKCSQCNTVNRIPDIRVIFAKSLKASDTVELEVEKKQRIELQKKYDKLIKQIELSKAQVQNGSTVFINQPKMEPATTTQISQFVNVLHSTQMPQVTALPHDASGLITLANRIGATKLRSPLGFCLRNNGLELVVCNATKFCVSVFSISGNFISDIGSRYVSGGSLRNPFNVAVTRSNKCIVVDTSNVSDLKMFDALGTFQRTIYSVAFLWEIKINQSDEIIILASACSNPPSTPDSRLDNFIGRLSQDGTVLKRVEMPTIYSPTDFVTHEMKYFVSGKENDSYMTSSFIFLINESSEIVLKINTSARNPSRICMGPNNDLYLHEYKRLSTDFSIRVFSISGVFKKLFFYSGPTAIRVSTGLEVLPNGSLLTVVKKENAVFMFDPLNF